MLKILSKFGSIDSAFQADTIHTDELLNVLHKYKPNTKRHYLDAGRDSVVFRNTQSTEIVKTYMTLSIRQTNLYYAIQKAFHEFCKTAPTSYYKFGRLEKTYDPSPSNISTVYPNQKDIIQFSIQNNMQIVLATVPLSHGQQRIVTDFEQSDLKNLYQLFLSKYMPDKAHKIFYTSSRSDDELQFISAPNVRVDDTGHWTITDVNNISHFIKTIEENCPDCYSIFGVEL